MVVTALSALGFLTLTFGQSWFQTQSEVAELRLPNLEDPLLDEWARFAFENPAEASVIREATESPEYRAWRQAEIQSVLNPRPLVIDDADPAQAYALRSILQPWELIAEQDKNLTEEQRLEQLRIELSITDPKAYVERFPDPNAALKHQRQQEARELLNHAAELLEGKAP
jgi:hypothetical protein